MTAVEEPNVSQSKYFRATFFLLWNFDILTRTHGKEEGKDGELRNRALLFRKLALGNFGDDTGGDGLLLFFFGVFVFESAELSL